MVQFRRYKKKNGDVMDLFSYGEGKLSVERQTFETIKEKVDFSYEEFMGLSDFERSEWIEACRLALLLSEEKRSELYEGYNFTDMFDGNGNFNLGSATCIIRSKKRALSVIEKYTDIEFTPAQFILLGEKGSQEVIKQGLQIINHDNAKDLDEGRAIVAEQNKQESSCVLCDEARRFTEEFYKKYGNGFDEDKAIYWK